jgi:hypothetical protein
VRQQRARRLPGVRDVQRQISAHALRRSQDQQMPDVSAPVVPNQHDALNGQLVKQRQHVADDLLFEPSVRRWT